jgi:hypothetical protein
MTVRKILLQSHALLKMGRRGWLKLDYHSAKHGEDPEQMAPDEPTPFIPGEGKKGGNMA